MVSSGCCVTFLDNFDVASSGTVDSYAKELIDRYEVSDKACLEALALRTGEQALH